MSGIDDLLYPDNKNRYARAMQLADDVNSLAADIARKKDEIDAVLKLTNKEIDKAYRPFLPEGVGTQEVTISPSDIEKVTSVVSKILTPMFAFKYAVKALEKVAVTWLVQSGRIGEAAFTKLVGLPTWFKAGKFAGGVGAAVVTELIIGAIEGAAQRATLQEAIHGLIQPRIELQKNLMIADMVHSTVQSVGMAVNSVEGLGLGKEQLDAMVKNLVDKFKVNVEAVTLEAAAAKLAERDRNRKAWTDEDA